MTANERYQAVHYELPTGSELRLAPISMTYAGQDAAHELARTSLHVLHSAYQAGYEGLAENGLPFDAARERFDPYDPQVLNEYQTKVRHQETLGSTYWQGTYYEGEAAVVAIGKVTPSRHRLVRRIPGVAQGLMPARVRNGNTFLNDIAVDANLQRTAPTESREQPRIGVTVMHAMLRQETARGRHHGALITDVFRASKLRPLIDRLGLIELSTPVDPVSFGPNELHATRYSTPADVKLHHIINRLERLYPHLQTARMV